MKTMVMVGLAVVGFAIASAQAGGLACAVDVVLQEKDGGVIEWAGHKFQVQPVEVTEKDKRSHVLGGTILYGKEKVAYRIAKERGAVKSIEMQVNGGMWLPISPEVTRALGDYCITSNVQEKKQGEIHQALYKTGKDGGSSWKRTAELIIAFVAIRHC